MVIKTVQLNELLNLFKVSHIQGKQERNQLLHVQTKSHLIQNAEVIIDED